MPPRVKRRTYDATGRRQAAESTRRSILEAARRLFLERGYAATTMPAIARAAGVALDTVYAAVGRKPALFRLLVELAISGAQDPVPAEARDYVRAIRAEPEAGRKLEIYAAALPALHERLAPLFLVLQAAAPLDADLRSLWREISQRRAANMRLLARDLEATGGLREDLPVDAVADVIWSTNSPELYLLLVQQRGWSPERYQRWLAEAWKLLLLRR